MDLVFGDFVWHDEKAARNERDHGVTFEEAALALVNDPNEVAVEDPTEPGRVDSLVWSRRGRVLFVVTTEASGERTRIISARKATNDEERVYQAGT